MVKAMKYRDIERALRHHNCQPVKGGIRGDHQKWRCPCGQHQVTIVIAREVSPGVVRDAIKKLKCLPEGWLQ